MAKTTPATRDHSLKTLALILGVSALPLVSGMTGCFLGGHYKQSSGEYTDDRALSTQVQKVLDEDTQFKYSGVNVAAFKGVVQLSGFVNQSAQKNRAGELARNAKGVTEVQNNITVKE